MQSMMRTQVLRVLQVSKQLGKQHAYGPVTVGMSNNDYDVGATGTDQETDSCCIYCIR